jgi:glycosyltransferase involved in cell wall biosynthesis
MKENSRRILIILSPGFPGDENETSCLPTQQLLIRALNRNFPELNIIILAFQYPFKNSNYQWYGNRVISFNGQSRPKLHRLLLWLKTWRKLQQLKKEHDLIGIFSFWHTECALMGKYFGKLYNLRHFNWILGQDVKKENRYVGLIRPERDSLVALSDFIVREFHKNHGLKPKHLIPAAVEPLLFDSSPMERDIDILASGSLIPLKQYDIFIEVVAGLSRQMPFLKAIHCGTGPEAEKLKQRARELHLEKTLSFLGERPHPEVLKLMQSSKVFLHTSSYEGFGAVCLEALYAGAHVISFCQPMDKEIKNWHIVSTKEEMIRKALEILTDADTKYESVCFNTFDESAKAVMQLFGQ